MNPKVVLVFGVRSDAIKMAPIVKCLMKQNRIDLKVLVTGQHDSMLNEVLDVFDIQPDYNLNLMSKVSNIIEFMSIAMIEISKILEKEKPDLVLTHGDTSSSVAASMAALYTGVKVAHVEGGLRSGNKFNPFPEEINRRIDDIISEIYFVPTITNRKNLEFKDYNQDNIFITGNTCIDALLEVTSKEITTEIPLLKDLYSTNKKIITITMHRRENWGIPFKNAFNAFKEIVKKYNDVIIVFPVHLNPNVRNLAYKELDGSERIYLMEPLNFIEFANLMKKSFLIITDSGGIQEEAPALGKPVLVTRNNTERWEAIESGTVKLVGTEMSSIVKEADKLLNSPEYYNSMAKARNPYGDGNSARRIVDCLYYYFGISKSRPEDFLQ